MSALSKFMRDNSPAQARRNKVDWYAWLAAQPQRMQVRDFRLTPYRADGTLDYYRQYVSYAGRGA